MLTRPVTQSFCRLVLTPGGISSNTFTLLSFNCRRSAIVKA